MRLTFLLPLLGLLAFACSSASSAAPTLCKPNSESYCRCQDRSEGQKTCASDGSGYGKCEPCESNQNPEVPLGPDDGDGGHVMPTCGDGIVQEDEDCDDKNGNDSDGCDSHCHLSGDNPAASRSCPGLDIHVWSEPVVYATTTVGSTNTAAAAPSCPSATGHSAVSGSTSSDRVFHVTAHRTGTMTVTTNQADFDHWIYASKSCVPINPGNEYNTYVACANQAASNESETVSFPVEAGKGYTVFVDGVLASQGAFGISFKIE